MQAGGPSEDPRAPEAASPTPPSRDRPTGSHSHSDSPVGEPDAAEEDHGAPWPWFAPVQSHGSAFRHGAGAAPHAMSEAGEDIQSHGSAVRHGAVPLAFSAAGEYISVPRAPDAPSHDAVLPLRSRRHSTSTTRMLFSEFYRSTRSPLSLLRQHSQPMPPGPDCDPDLLSRDKQRQKEAIRRFLGPRIRNDWEFPWTLTATAPPPPGPVTAEHAPTESTAVEPAPGEGEPPETTDDDDDATSMYSTVSEDPAHFQPRAEWLSDLSDGDPSAPPSAPSLTPPASVGSSPRKTKTSLSRQRRRRRALRKEMRWNAGLACFHARRDAWTGARTVRVRSKPISPPPRARSRRRSFWRLPSPISPSTPKDSAAVMPPLSPIVTGASGETTAVASTDDDSREAFEPSSSTHPVKTLLPRPPPLLPPANPIRAAITPARYRSLYDKIVAQSFTPVCPVNLSDITRACVVGWKQAGDWPACAETFAQACNDAPPPLVASKKKKEPTSTSSTVTRRRTALGLLGRRESRPAEPAGAAAAEQGNITTRDEGSRKGIKKIQKALGLGHEGKEGD